MTNYILASDNINGKERTYLSQISSKLQEANHEVTIAGVGPNTIQTASGQSGHTGVFLVGGSDAGMYVDFVQGLSRGYYKYDKMIVAFASWAGSDWISEQGLKTKKLRRAQDDNYSSASNLAKVVGKTVEEYFSENSKYLGYAYGDNASEIADMILNSTSSSSTENNNGGGSVSSYKEMLQQLAYPLDGDIEIRIVWDTVYVNKIPEPSSSSSSLVVEEGKNLISGSLTVTDYNPDTVNKLVVTYGSSQTITIVDEYLISRFGEKVREVKAVEVVETTTTASASDSSDSSSDSADDSTSSNSSTTTSTTRDITDYDEALSFAKREWSKLHRDDGHTIECKIVGGAEDWQVGKWCKVNVPRFGENMYMYVAKASHSRASSESLVVSLSLKDYPPKIGVEQETNDDSSTTGDDPDSTTTSADGSDSSTSSSTSSSSSSSSKKSTSSSSKWTKIANIVNSSIVVSEGKTDQYIRRLMNAGNNWTSIAVIVNGHKMKNGKSMNSVIRAILNAKK